jgi:MFS family permease
MAPTSTVRKRDELRLSLNLIIVAITFGMAFFTVVNGPTMSAFVRTLGLGDFIYSVIISLPVFSGIMQLFASILVRKAGRRKPAFIVAGLVHRLVMIPVALVPLFIPSQFEGARVWILIILLAVSNTGAAFTNIIFGSWVGALVPMEIRGRYFSKRSMISTITVAITAPLSGLFLDLVKGSVGYAILFLVVSILGAIDILCFFWVKDPPMIVSESSKNLLAHFTQPLRDPTYRRLIVFVAAWGFAVNLSGPFFTPYMIEVLGMNMLSITLATQTTMSIVTVLFIRRIGRLIDRFGVKPVLLLSTIVIVTLPFMWLFSYPGGLWLVVLIHIISGIVWPTYEMCAMNLSIWLAPEEERPSYLAAYALVTALFGMLLGQLSGGAIMQAIGPAIRMAKWSWIFNTQFQPFHVLLILTIVFRFLALFFILLPMKDNEDKGTMTDVTKAFFTPLNGWRSHQRRAERNER